MRSSNLYKSILFITVLSLAASSGFAQTAPPRVFFTDLTSGPNTGGENNQGTILTIYGKNFGGTQGTSSVTIGGGAVAAVKQWGGRSKAATTAAQLETISVAIGSSAATGTVAVTTSSGASTCEDSLDACHFTVRSGNIHCVSTAGADSGGGTFPSSCWKTIPYARKQLLPGDIAYVENGVAATVVDDYQAALAITGNSCTSTSPCALVVYPGATATIGTNSIQLGARTPSVSGSKDYWVLAGFNLVAQIGALDLVGVTGWRVINNNFTCPMGNGQAACHHTDTTTYERFYGNYVHNVGDQAGSIDKYYHGIYFTTNSNHIWAGWNESNNNPTGSTTAGGCRAIQFFSTGGADQFDLHVHDNWIHNAICDGINFSTVNPDSGGVVEAYNNVVFHVGTGPDPGNGGSDYACIVAGGGGTGAVLAYNNTFYDCGGRKATDSGVAYVARALTLSNNAIQQLSGESYLTSSSTPSLLSGSNNIWYGLSNAPSQTSANITTDPLFVSVGTDFSLQSTSPAVDAGTSSRESSWDFAGNSRPSPPSIGAYDSGSSTNVQRPNPPTSLAATVN